MVGIALAVSHDVQWLKVCGFVKKILEVGAGSATCIEVLVMWYSYHKGSTSIFARITQNDQDMNKNRSELVSTPDPASPVKIIGFARGLHGVSSNLTHVICTSSEGEIWFRCTAHLG